MWILVKLTFSLPAESLSSRLGWMLETKPLVCEYILLLSRASSGTSSVRVLGVSVNRKLVKCGLWSNRAIALSKSVWRTIGMYTLKQKVIQKFIIQTFENMTCIAIRIPDYEKKCQKQPLEVFYKKICVKNFAIFRVKHLCWSLFLTKLQAFRPATLFKETPAHVFFLWILTL